MYEVEILPAAHDDMIDAVRYVAGELGMRHAAESLARDFATAAQSLADMPWTHRAYTPVRPLMHEYRRVYIGDYAMFYWIDEPNRRVTVARVIYARRDLASHME